MRVNSCIRILAASSVSCREAGRDRSEQKQRGQLRSESLGGSHADLRPGVRWNCAVGSRVIMEPITLQIASEGEPFNFASRWAASVSAVSPDWLMHTVSVFESMRGRDNGTHCRSPLQRARASVLDH